MGTEDKTIYPGKKPHILEELDSTPERSFFTPWLFGNKGFFRVHLTIVGPQSEQPQNYFSLSRSKRERSLEAIADQVILLKKELR